MRKAGIYSVVAAAGFAATACSSDITVPNYNNPTTGGVASDPSSLQLIANGIAFQSGAQAAAYIDDLGKFGRESFQYTPTEGRNTTNYLPVARLDRAGFAATYWFGRYNNIRNTFNLLNATEASTITPAGKAAARGFAKTMEALELQYVIATRDTIGAPVEVRAELDFVAPFVSRDSVYRYISNRLDEAATDLAAGGTDVPVRGEHAVHRARGDHPEHLPALQPGDRGAGVRLPRLARHELRRVELLPAGPRGGERLVPRHRGADEPGDAGCRRVQHLRDVNRRDAEHPEPGDVRGGAPLRAPLHPA
jgi:hypothetical protein